METIQIDTNSVHKENDEIYLSENDVQFFNLCDDMEINAYEGDEVWNAVVHKFISSDNCESWYVELLSLKGTISQNQSEWNTIGFNNGYCLGEGITKSVIVQRMLNLGYGLDEIDNVVCMNSELKRKAEIYIKNNKKELL